MIDAFRRRIVGWRVAATLRAVLALDALEMAIGAQARDDLDGLVTTPTAGSVPLNSLQRAPRRGGRGRLGGEQGRLLQQRPRRDRQRPLQARAGEVAAKIDIR